ncbi:MAG: hypothetical protein ACO3D5_08285, partial [Ilumatobacteraceae bacterium]
KVYSGSAWRKMLHSVVSGGDYTDAITITEANGQVTLTLNLADTDSAGLLSSTFWNMLNDATADATASKLVKRDANGNAKVATPTDAAHIATKGYVDAARQGLDVKQSVRAATTAAVNLSTDLEDGDSLDGVTLATGDRILVKDQGGSGVAHVDNGIYVVQASGAPVRASDSNGTADTGELSPGTFTFVEEGTVNSDKGFVISTNGTITVGSTAIAWTQFSGAGSFVAGDGLSQSGNTINVNVVSDRTAITGDAVDIASTYVGQTSITTLGTITTGTWEATDVAVEHGGTNASTESGARTNLASAASEATGRTTSTPSLSRVAKQGCAASVGGVSTTTVTHNFNTTDVLIQVYEVSSGATVIGDTIRANSNSVSVVLNGTISANDYTIVVTG